MVDSAGPLVGRAEELALVERALADVAAGSAVALGITGEPGIVKRSSGPPVKIRSRQSFGAAPAIQRQPPR